MDLLRRTFLWASRDPRLASALPRRRFVRRAVRRFMPGETLDEAFAAVETLSARGVPSILTILGENVETRDEVRDVADEYRRALDRADDGGLDMEISVKPTHLGIDIDPALAHDTISELAERAGGRGTLWIDMESTAHTDATLELFRALREEHDGVGVCLQAYLRRTPADLEALLPLGPRIRLVKGAYAEPVELAFPDKADVDASYLSLAETLIDHLAAGGDGFLALGTHDPGMIAPLTGRAGSAGLDGSRYEVEMLYGIGRAEQRRLAEEGLPLRILISYGSAWFPWYMRRLAERPANVWFVLRSLVG